MRGCWKLGLKKLPGDRTQPDQKRQGGTAGTFAATVTISTCFFSSHHSKFILYQLNKLIFSKFSAKKFIILWVESGTRRELELLHLLPPPHKTLPTSSTVCNIRNTIPFISFKVSLNIISSPQSTNLYPVSITWELN